MTQTEEKHIWLRKRFSRTVRYVVYVVRANWPLSSLVSLRNCKRGRRVFLLGSGPSLAKMDLKLLAGEDVCVVNMGVRALDAGLPNVEIHIATDKNRYVRFADDMERYATVHRIPLRFFGIWVKKLWYQRRSEASTPRFLVVGRKSFLQRGFKTTPLLGYGSSGTVLIFALQVLYYLGYREVYVAGVDLDYTQEQPYFYSLQDADKVHELDAKVQARRPLMDNANVEFEIARKTFEADDRKLVNIGIGGNLVVLPRSTLEAVIAQQKL